MRRNPAGKRALNKVRPASSGFIYFALLAAVWLTAANYMNNLAYFSFFILFTLAISSLIYSKLYLSLLSIASMELENAFAGGKVSMVIFIRNATRTHRQGIFVSTEIEGLKSEIRHGPFFIDADGITPIKIFIPFEKRGVYTLTGITLFSIQPLGLYLSMKKETMTREIVIFPQPSGKKLWNPAVPSTEERLEGFHVGGGEDYSGSRLYREGESPRHIDWKALARGRPMMVKEFSGGGGQEYWFDWWQLPGIEPEQRLSQIARWILGGDRLGIEFGIRIPGEIIPPDSGSLHTMACLRALASFRGEE